MPAQPSTIASARSSSMRRGDLGRDAFPRRAARPLQFEHRHAGGAHRGAAEGEPVAQQVLFEHGNGARQRGHHAEPAGDQRRQVIGGLADADHRRPGQRPRRVEAGVVEAGDDVRVGARRLALADFGEQARQAERPVEEALDRDRPARRGRRRDLGPRRRRPFGREHATLAVIDAVVFGIDDPDAHGRSGDLRRRAAWRRSRTMVASASRMMRNENAVVTVPSA